MLESEGPLVFEEPFSLQLDVARRAYLFPASGFFVVSDLPASFASVFGSGFPASTAAAGSAATTVGVAVACEATGADFAGSAVADVGVASDFFSSQPAPTPTRAMHSDKVE